MSDELTRNVVEHVQKTNQKWGVGCIAIKDHKMLMGLRCKEGDKPEWCFPGGSVEVGETPFAGVRRELFEETGLTAYKLELIASYYKSEYQDFLFVTDDFKGKLKPQEGELSELRWVTVEEAYKLPLFPFTKDSLDIIVEMNKKDNRFDLDIPEGYDRTNVVENYYRAINALGAIGTTKNIPEELKQLCLDASSTTLKIINYVNDNK